MGCRLKDSGRAPRPRNPQSPCAEGTSVGGQRELEQSLPLGGPRALGRAAGDRGCDLSSAAADAACVLWVCGDRVGGCHQCLRRRGEPCSALTDSTQRTGTQQGPGRRPSGRAPPRRLRTGAGSQQHSHHGLPHWDWPSPLLETHPLRRAPPRQLSEYRFLDRAGPRCWSTKATC